MIDCLVDKMRLLAKPDDMRAQLPALFATVADCNGLCADINDCLVIFSYNFV